MAELRGIEYLRNKLNTKSTRVLTRYKYYEMKNVARDMGISTPPELKNFKEVLGWCGKAVDSIADRLMFREFENDNFNLTEIFNMNNPDVLYDSAVRSALISSCCFIYISQDSTGYPRLEVIDGGSATGVINTITGLLDEGYAVLEQNPDTEKPVVEAYFEPGKTTYYKSGEAPWTAYYNVDYPLLVPMIYKPSTKRPFGHSRISRACMSIVDSALRTIKRSEISAEFFAFPQKYAIGVADDALEMNKWKASMSALLTMTRDENGNIPTLGQFQQQSMAPHTEQLKMFAALFGGETGLTLDDLGFSTGNPASADAIKAAHENLRLAARKAQGNFGTGLLNAGYLAACVRDDYRYLRKQFYLTRPTWEPIFEPDAAMLSAIGDGAIKLNQAVPGYMNKDNLRNLTGIDASKLPVPVDKTGGA